MSLLANRLHLSQISPRVVQSEIRAMTVECDRLGGVNLAQGVCDTEVPPPVLEAAIRAIREGHNIYTRMDGIRPLREAIARKLAAYNRVDADPESEVLVTSGATGALYAACLALLDPGDEVLLFEPFYGYHVSTLRALRMQPVPVPMHGPQWEIDLDAVRAAITPRCRALIVNSPCNPSGKVFSQSELEAVAQIAIEYDLFVFTDEIYEYFIYSGARHVSIASLPDMAERCITISGLSKTFSITGWRLGYLAAHRQWVAAIAYFHDLTYVCAPSPFQYAAAAGLVDLPESFYTGLAAEYEAKRDRMCEALSEAGLTPTIPDGAYYILADATTLPGANAQQKARTLLRETGVAAVAGSAFFAEGRGEDLLRFCFAKQDADLARAAALLKSRPCR